MHFTQPATRCRMWLWKSQGAPFRALIILEHFRNLINGLAAIMLALNISRNFDGLKGLFAPVVEKKQTSLLWWGVAFSFAENVKGKPPLPRELCFMAVINHFGCGSLLCGLWRVKNMETVRSDWKGFLVLAVTIRPGTGFINCVVRWCAQSEASWLLSRWIHIQI